jgi:copper ion binding protein
LVTSDVRKRIADAVTDMGFEVAGADDRRAKAIHDAIMVATPLVVPSAAEFQTVAAAPQQVSSRFDVEGMTCSSCVAAIEQAVSKTAGVSEATVNLISRVATVKHDPSVISPKLVGGVIEDAGFVALLLAGADDDVATATLDIGGMTCSSCVGAIEAGLLAQDGVIAASVNLLQGSGTVTYKPSVAHVRDLLEHLEDLGSATIYTVPRCTPLQAQCLLKHILFREGSI